MVGQQELPSPFRGTCRVLVKGKFGGKDGPHIMTVMVVVVV